MNIKKTALFLLAALLIGTTCTNAQTLLDKLKKFAGPSDELIKKNLINLVSIRSLIFFITVYLL